MTLIRNGRYHTYQAINTDCLEDPRLSFGAKGLWIYLVSVPTITELKVEKLTYISKESEEQILSLIEELTTVGYLIKVIGPGSDIPTYEMISVDSEEDV